MGSEPRAKDVVSFLDRACLGKTRAQREFDTRLLAKLRDTGPQNSAGSGPHQRVLSRETGAFEAQLRLLAQTTAVEVSKSDRSTPKYAYTTQLSSVTAPNGARVSCCERRFNAKTVDLSGWLRRRRRGLSLWRLQSINKPEHRHRGALNRVPRERAVESSYQSELDRRAYMKQSTHVELPFAALKTTDSWHCLFGEQS